MPFPWSVQDSEQHEVFGIFFVVIHGFRMPVFFVMSGFFTAMLWRRRGLGSILKQRFLRVFLPCMLGIYTICSLQDWVGDFVHNTWRFGIDRILAGVAMSDDSQAWLDTTLPLDDVSSNRVELAGRLAEFVARLQATVQALSGAKPLRQWLTGVADGIT